MTDDNSAKVRLAQLESTVDAKEVEFAEKSARVAALEARVGELMSEAEKIQGQLIDRRMQYEQMEKQVSQIEETHRVLSDRILQAQMARSLNLGEANISVVSPALIPTTPVKPNKKLNMAVAGVLGVFLAVGLVFVLEYLDNTMKNPDDVRKHLGLPTLGNIPVIE
jgi:capsular polysaccharide biosynthesis protein